MYPKVPKYDGGRLCKTIDSTHTDTNMEKIGVSGEGDSLFSGGTQVNYFLSLF